MNTLTLHDDELKVITSALNARHAQMIWAQQFGQAREIEYVAERLLEQLEPKNYWYWVSFHDLTNIEIVTAQQLLDNPPIDFGPSYVTGMSGWIPDYLVGPFSTEGAAQQVVDAFVNDDQHPQKWWWLDISGGYVSYHLALEMPYIYPTTFSHDYIHCWDGPFTREDVVRLLADDLNAHRGYYDAC